MKADRLLSILLLLQSRGRLTGRELAERLEVSARTVHRDMEALSAAGVPVFALRGSRGGWELEDGWRTRVPGLNAGELEALLLAQPRALGDARLARAAERALEKLTASLPAVLRDQAASIRQRLHVDTTSWWGPPEDLSMLPTVQEAVSAGRRLMIRYWPARRERVERTIDPLGLVAKGSAWYLVAQTPDGLRTYRVSRMEEATMLDQPCERPDGFDLAAYWKSSTEELRRGRQRYRAVLRLDSRAARSFGAWPGSEAVTADEPARDDARTTMRVAFDDEEQALFVVLGFGSRVEVVAPESLAQRVAGEVATLAARTKTG